MSDVHRKNLKSTVVGRTIKKVESLRGNLVFTLDDGEEFWTREDDTFDKDGMYFSLLGVDEHEEKS